MTVEFCSWDSGTHGARKPRTMKAKKSSPAIRAQRSNRSASVLATVDLPAPGGPVITTSPATASFSAGGTQRSLAEPGRRFASI